MFSYSLCKNGAPQSGTLWPPFRPLKPLPEKFHGLMHILHSRKLHGVLFFIFHKVNLVILSGLPRVVKTCGMFSLFRSLLARVWFLFNGLLVLVFSLFCAIPEADLLSRRGWTICSVSLTLSERTNFDFAKWAVSQLMNIRNGVVHVTIQL